MNLFYLDDNLDKCAEYHIDKHVLKMQLEAAQLLTTALWVDKLIGYVPRALTPDELAMVKEASKAEPAIDERKFTRYLPTHHNHPSNIWVRSSLEHFYWTINYVNALNEEAQYRGYKPHASCREANRLPEPKALVDTGFRPPTQAMSDNYKQSDTVQAYRSYYLGEKASIASWKVRGEPYWWKENK